MNKRLELDKILNCKTHKPDIIGIVEVKPKSCKQRPQVSELAMQGYDTNCINIDDESGRGVILYTAAWLKASPYTPGHPCQESTWVKIKLKDKDNVIIGCIYRSPSSTTTNDEDICQQIKTVCTNNEASHVLILGDFNFPDINWDCWSTPSDYGSDKKFLDTVKDCYLYQHVSCPTRAQASQQPSTLDLVLTNEEGTVSSLELLASLGKSDHGILSFQLHCYINIYADNNIMRNYRPNKGNYDELRNQVALDWDSLLKPLDGDAEEQFRLFSDILEKAVESCVPTHKHSFESRQCRAPMDKTYRKLIRRKNRLWTRYMETRDISKYRQYCICRNKVRAATRASRQEYEKQVAAKAKTEPKNFWKYANSKLKTRSNIPDLFIDTSKNVLTSSDQEKVEVLSSFFASVFTHTANDDLPSVDNKHIQYPMEPLNIDKNNCGKTLT